ncbi:hypothetical protein FRX31_005961 [Thalictrum thalictroides]|uniref:Uncharacterized protein n=1 Tax=Thalictrum thalictroides TaxID=46969 RepID=A0A7J6X6I8_THATH|nr:hypothetical protein FRX31_005961 [Thalictrum thalictroides]
MAAIEVMENGMVQAVAYRRGRTSSAQEAKLIRVEVAVKLARKRGLRKINIKMMLRRSCKV